MLQSSVYIWFVAIALLLLGSLFLIFKGLRRLGSWILYGSIALWLLSTVMCSFDLVRQTAKEATRPLPPRAARAPEPAKPPPATGKWDGGTHSVSRMDDSTSLAYNLRSETRFLWPDATASSGQRGYTPLLRVWCDEGKTSAYVQLNRETKALTDHALSGKSHLRAVRLRFDSEPPLAQEWSVSTDEVALFSPEPIAFARKIARSKRMLFEFTTIDGVTRIAEFEVAGFDAFTPVLAGACAWKP